MHFPPPNFLLTAQDSLRSHESLGGETHFPPPNFLLTAQDSLRSHESIGGETHFRRLNIFFLSAPDWPRSSES
jgi:hypothetical protein